MHAFATACLVLDAVVVIAFGLRYMLAREFMAYHAVVAGRTWAEVPEGLRAIVLGMYTIMGGGFITYGTALLLLLVPLREGGAWAVAAALAVLTLTVTMCLPILYVTLWLRRVRPGARTPVVPTVVALLLAIAGALPALVS
jgi:hypothetical protein